VATLQYPEKTAAAAAAADAGVVFYHFGVTGINAVEYYQEQDRAANGFSKSHWRARAKSVYNELNSLQCARGINSAEYGRRRRTGAAEPRPTFIGPAGRAKGVAIRCRPPWEQVQGALVPPPCEPAA